MGGVHDGPEQYPGWDRVRYPSDYPVDSADRPGPEATPPHPLSRPAFPPLPPIPPMAQPTAVFVARDDTAPLLARALAERVLFHWTFVVSMGISWLALLPATWYFWGVPGIAAAAMVIAATLAGRLMRRGPFARQLQRAYDGFAAPGMVIAARFGPDACDIQRADSFQRIRYDRIRGIHTTDAVVLLRTGGGYQPFPGELFPEQARDLIRQPHPAPPLPPIPPLDQPTAVFVAGPGTVRDLVKAVMRQTNSDLAVLLGIALMVLVPITAFTAGPVGALTAVVLAALAVLGRLIWTIPATRRSERDVADYAAPGQTLATRFGSDTVEIHTATGRTRIPYASLRLLRVRDSAVILLHGPLIAYPRELFPDIAIDYIRTIRPELAR
ncbi:hypothetical protein [Nocardia crassostreae]|uniref:hypothetical protein n=1 Tax=Nocardia crassostreae TaxID=53428 RepID=UPI0008377401|nr:hypothetical protein [Nocardia crassostreae]